MRKIIAENNTETAASTNTVEEMTKKQLVAEYNLLCKVTGNSEIKSFSDRATGIERVNKLMDMAEKLEAAIPEIVEEKKAKKVKAPKTTKKGRSAGGSPLGMTIEILTENKQGTKLAKKKLYKCGDFPVVAYKKAWHTVEFNAASKMKPGKVLEAYEGRPAVVPA